MGLGKLDVARTSSTFTHKRALILRGKKIIREEVEDMLSQEWFPTSYPSSSYAIRGFYCSIGPTKHWCYFWLFSFFISFYFYIRNRINAHKAFFNCASDSLYETLIGLSTMPHWLLEGETIILIRQPSSFYKGYFSGVGNVLFTLWKDMNVHEYIGLNRRLIVFDYA